MIRASNLTPVTFLSGVVFLLASSSNLCNGFGVPKTASLCRHVSKLSTPKDISVNKPSSSMPHKSHGVMKRCSSSTKTSNYRFGSRITLFGNGNDVNNNDGIVDNDVDNDFKVMQAFETQRMSELEQKSDFWLSPTVSTAIMATSVAVTTAMILGNGGDLIIPSSYAADTIITNVPATFQGLSQGTLNPANFQPVCATSDGFYRLLQSSTIAIIGKESFVEYGPLIAGGLLRIRLELCVVESFFNEAVGPFIAQNGLSWVLPIRETVESFIAGGIFAIASTFILLSSTKLITVIATYTDFIFGAPSRLLGGYTFDRAQGKPVTLDVGLGPFQTRIIGPPDTKPGEEPKVEFSLSNTNIFTIVILIISGTVKAAGELLGVSFKRICFFLFTVLLS